MVPSSATFYTEEKLLKGLPTHIFEKASWIYQIKEILKIIYN